MDQSIDKFNNVLRKRKAEEALDDERKRIKLDSGEEDSAEASTVHNLYFIRSSNT